MTDELSVEATGETVGEAKWKALRDLERLRPGSTRRAFASRSSPRESVACSESATRPARVIATVDRPDEPRRAERARRDRAVEARVRELVEHVVVAIGVGCRVDVREDEDGDRRNCTGGDLGLLIGKHGQTIDAMQYVANASLVARRHERQAGDVDAAGYRERRRATLEGIAMRGAERRGGRRAVLLEPMTAVERKVVHERLKELPGVETSSEGTEPNRYVVVFPA